MTRLEAIGEEIWTCAVPFSIMGFRLGGRMTVVRLGSGGLALHSPVKIDESLRAEVDALGPVEALIAPSLFHHLFVQPWSDAYPDARRWIPAGLETKRPELAGSETLDTAGPEVLDGALRRWRVEGVPSMQEDVFFHAASGTLILTDLLFYLPEARGLTGLYARMAGLRDGPGCSPLYRSMIRDKAAFRASLQPLRALDVQALSMCHHRVVHEDARAKLRAALDALGVPAVEGTSPAEGGGPR